MFPSCHLFSLTEKVCRAVCLLISEYEIYVCARFILNARGQTRSMSQFGFVRQVCPHIQKRGQMIRNSSVEVKIYLCRVIFNTVLVGVVRCTRNFKMMAQTKQGLTTSKYSLYFGMFMQV